MAHQNRPIKQIWLQEARASCFWRKSESTHLSGAEVAIINVRVAMAEGEEGRVFCLSLARKQCIGISCLPNLASSHRLLYQLLRLPRLLIPSVVITLLAFSEDSLTSYIFPPDRGIPAHLPSNLHFRKKQLLVGSDFLSKQRSNLLTNSVDA